MSDIHDLLSKHFLNEANPLEEIEVKKYKASNPDEYHALRKLWTTTNIHLSEFDSNTAWDSVIKKTSKPKTISLYRKLYRVAAVAAVLVLGALFAIQNLGDEVAGKEITKLIGDGTKDGITLEDGSVIYLNKGATLSYPTSFDVAERLVTLTGEAYFDIERDENRPFKIKTPHSEVEVLGTSFNIDATELVTEVAVTSGKVKVSSLTTNEQAILVKSQAAKVSAKKLETYSNENKNFVAWRTGKFSFVDQQVSHIIDELNTYYENRIILKNTNSDCPLSATFDKTTLSEIVEILTLTCNLNLKTTNETYELN